MPRIRARTLADHHETTWTALVDALERLLASKPYDAITVAEIAEAAGIARNTLYNYARDKPALLAAAAEQSANALRTRVATIAANPGGASNRLTAVIRAILYWFGADKRRHILVQSLFSGLPATVQSRASLPLTKMLVHVATIIADGMATGEFEEVVDPEMTLALMAGVMRPAVLRVAQNPAQAPRVERETIRFLMAALRPKGES